MSNPTFNINSVIDDAKKVITNPVGFYREMAISGGFVNPLIFVITMAFIAAVIISLFSLLKLSSFNAFMGGKASIATLIVMPIAATIGSFIAAAVLFVIWKLMGSDKNYECAYRCVAHSFAIAPVIAVLSIVPYLPNILKTLWGCFLMYTASIEVHKLNTNTPKIVFGILAVLGVIFGLKSEHSVRNFQHRMDKMGEMTPEQAGKEFGKFMKGLEQFQEGMEKSTQPE